VGTPQGSIISPILANVFLHELDKFAGILKSEFDRGTRARRTHIARSIEYQIVKAKANGDMDLVKKLTTQRALTPATDYRDESYRKLSYIRYADDWIVGVRGTHNEAVAIQDKITKFCEQLGLKVSESKTKITNLNSEKALFLGTFISRSHHTRFFYNYRNVIQRSSLKLRFEAPLDRIKRKLDGVGFLKSNKPHPRFIWLHHNHDQILYLYNAVLRGYLNYYSFVHNYPQMVSLVHFILKQSCARLLTAKFSLGTLKKTYTKFGNRLESPSGIKFMKPSYRTTPEPGVSANPVVTALYASKSLASLEDLSCSVCGSSHRVEMHHVRAMKDLNPKLSLIDQLMVKANRKQIPLCKVCHYREAQRDPPG
jgi:hypothetical protein